VKGKFEITIVLATFFVGAAWGLVPRPDAHYSFENPGDLGADGSGYYRNLTVVENPSNWVDDPNYVAIGAGAMGYHGDCAAETRTEDAAWLNGSMAYSVSFWARTWEWTGPYMLISHGSMQNDDHGNIRVKKDLMSQGYIQYSPSIGGVPYVYSTQPGTWVKATQTHICITWSSGNEPKIYMHGKEVPWAVSAGAASGGYDLHATRPWIILGSRFSSVDPPGCVYPYAGALDDVAIWTATLDAKDVALIHGVGYHYKLDVLDDSIITLRDIYESGSGSCLIDGDMWVYMSGLGGTTGDAGGQAGMDAYIVLDDSGNGVGVEAVGCPCPGDLNGDDQIDLEDLQAVAGMLLQAGSPFVVPVEDGHCADLSPGAQGEAQVDLDDLQALAGVLLQAGNPFIVDCE